MTISEKEVEAALAAYHKASKCATGNSRAPAPCPYCMEKALEAAQRVREETRG
mgnify:CR=1 FL=1